MKNKKAQMFLIALLAWLVIVWLTATARDWFGPRFGDWPTYPSFKGYVLWLFLPLATWVIFGPLLDWFAGWPRPHLVVLIGFFTLLCVGHIFKAARETFPFVEWQMFTQSYYPPEIITYQYQGVLEDGSRVELNPVRLFPSLEHSRFYLQAIELGEKTRNPASNGYDVYDEFLIVIANKFNESASDGRVVSVEVRKTLTSIPFREFDKIQTEIVRVTTVPNAG